MDKEVGQIELPCTVRGTYHGIPFECKATTFAWSDGDPATAEMSFYWWSEGNMSCDCNRSEFLPESAGHNSDCGDEIYIDSITPDDARYPTLMLNETQFGKDEPTSWPEPTHVPTVLAISSR